MENENGIVEKTADNGGNSTGAPESKEPVNYEELYKTTAQSVAELTAERDSLLNENKELREAKEAAIADGAKAREMNYTLSRQLNLGQQAQKQPEDILAGMFLKKGD